MNPASEDLLLTLSPSSTLLVLLRALYRLLLDYGVLWPDGSEEPFVFRKEQLVVLIERGESESLVRDLPRLAEGGLIRPVSPEACEEEEGVRALLLERRGARILPLVEAAAPWEPEFPEWWEAPLPFALCARGQMRINRTAALMFGSDLERLNVADLPEKDEFIVDLEGRTPSCFLAFRRLEPDIFILEDCTDDLVEAQSISWWAGLGRAWIASIEGEGRTWRREEAPPEDFSGEAWPCEWEGRFQGWLCVESPEGTVPKPPDAVQAEEAEKAQEPVAIDVRAVKKKARPRRSSPKREDEVLKAIGPQTMGLLAPGQVPEEPEDKGKDRKRSAAGRETAPRRAGARGRGRPS